MATQQAKMPLLPRNQKDPTQSSKAVNRMQRDIEERYYGIKKDLADYIIPYLTGLETQTNAQRGAMVCNNEDADPSLYWVTVNAYSYDLDAMQLANLFTRIQQILDDWLLEGGPTQIWSGEYVAQEYQRGTQYAFTNLSSQSDVYAQQTTLSQLLFSQPYQTRIGIAYAQTYSDWKGLSDTARSDLANVISDAVARGINPRETAKIISQRLDVSMSKAKSIAQTEQVGAYRKAQWDEDEDAEKRLGIKSRLLWLSALKPTTRPWHASRHGNVYTREEVKDFYAKDGNRYRCYCSQQSVLVDDSGNPRSQKLIDKMAKQREAWKETEPA
jgi:SPP1 gp7 family putative phage head morphogenesis protein